MNLNEYIKNKHELKGAILGMLMGDLGMCKINGKNTNAWFTMTHSDEQLDYLNLKSKMLELNPLTTVRIQHRTTHLKKTNKDYSQWQAYSNRNSYATRIYNLVYPCGKKIVNENILNQITDLGLFLWYLDDGYLNIRKDSNGNIKEYRIFLYTMNFSLDEVKTIQSWFISKYNISPNINKKQNGYILYFNSKKTRQFMEIIDKYYDLVPCLHRKFLKEYIQ